MVLGWYVRVNRKAASRIPLNIYALAFIASERQDRDGVGPGTGTLFISICSHKYLKRG